MLQVAFIRKNIELVKERLKIKNFSEVELVDRIVALDDDRKKMQFDVDEIQAKLNTTAKEIGKLFAKGDTTAAELRKSEVAELKTTLAGISQKLHDTEQKLTDTLVLLPNLPHSSVPAGLTPEQNIIVKEQGTLPKLYEGAVPHWDLAKKYDLINFELGNKITGSGFPLFKNNGAKLQRALVRYFLEYNIAAGYTEYQPPLLVNEATAFGTGQLPDKEAQMYQVTADNLYMIPTSEVPLTNIYRDEIVKENDLPIMMTAYTPCFRREAGSYGKDVRGLNRVHQFDKVEIVQLVLPEKSYQVLEDMVEHVGKLLQSLQLPYRILRLCGGDLGFASAITYDFEVYSAAQKKWLEVSSVSNFETFQTNRMKIRYKDSSGKTQLLHTLNESSLALPRIVACLLENNQTADNIKLPQVLHDYFGGGEIK